MKKMFVTAITAGLILAGCTDSEPTVEPTPEVVEETTTTTEKERPTTTRKPTTTTTTIEVDDYDYWYNELVVAVGPEMADATVELGRSVCESIDLLGIDAAMDQAALIIYESTSTDDEMEFIVSSLMVGISLECPEYYDAMLAWAGA